MMRFYPGYDFFSYHIYNGWAFLNNRIDVDFMPASFRTYFNPVLDVLNFWLINILNNHPRIFMFISGFKFGIFLFLAYLLFDKIYINKGINKLASIIFTLVITFLSPVVFLCISYDWNDLQIADLILLSLYFYVDCIFKPSDKKRFIGLVLVGLFLGIATGLKYTAGLFCLSIIICTLICFKKIPDILKAVGTLFMGMISGFLIFDGLWAFKVFKHFQNPVFPYFNNIFKSSFGTIDSVVNIDFNHLRAHHLSDYFFYPLKNTIYENYSLEANYFDLKIIISVLLVVLYFILSAGKAIKQSLENIVEQKSFEIIIFFIMISYLLNSLVFGQIRYIIVLFPLCAIVITAFLQLYSDYLKNVKIPLLVCILFVCAGAFFNFKYTYGMSLQIFYVLIFILGAIAVFYVYFSKKLPEQSKNFLLILAFATLFFEGTTRNIDYCMLEDNWVEGSVLEVQRADIKDNSTVFCANMSSDFVVPFQNDKAKYIAYALQPEYQDFRNMLDMDRTGAHIEYTSPYLTDLIKKAFDEEEDVYILFSFQDMLNNSGAVIDIYRKSLEQYADNKISVFFTNCQTIDFKVFNFEIPDYSYMVCKIK